MTGNEYRALAARTMNKKLNPTEQEEHALHLFKAQRLHDRQWVEGYLTMNPNNGNAYIISHVCGGAHPDRVAPETICRYTGMKDKNGKKIWECDTAVMDDEEERQVFVSFEKGCWVVMGEEFWDFLYTNKESLKVTGNLNDREE